MNEFTAEEEDQMLLILSMLQACYGGTPCIEFLENNKVIIFCKDSSDFNEVYPSKECLSILEAALDYATNRSCYLQTLLFKQSGKELH